MNGGIDAMGFFSDLKEDLSQAVNELLPEDGAAVEEGKEGNQEETLSLDELLKNIDDIQLEPEGELADTLVSEEQSTASDTALEGEVFQEAASDSVADWNLESMLENALGEGTISEEAVSEETVAEVNEVLEEITVPTEETVEEGEEVMETNEGRVAVDETSIITAGMSIKGDISSEGSLEVIGGVIGNIDVYGKLNITGHIDGNSKAAEIYAEGAKINGEIVSEGAVKIGASTVIVGNITATSAAIAGAVKGDIDVKGPVVLDASAIVMGNIKSKSVQINNGAVIEGMCSQCYADVNPTSFFEDYKMETRKGKNK